jgi:hypothetical protein
VQELDAGSSEEKVSLCQFLAEPVLHLEGSLKPLHPKTDGSVALETALLRASPQSMAVVLVVPRDAGANIVILVTLGKEASDRAV